ncbi:MAG: hypothetical protein QOF29_444 [bacterium]|jgi:hypothetical protein
MRTLTTQQHYEVPGGTLKVVLTTDHVLTTVERDELDRVADACVRFQVIQRSEHPHPPADGADPAGEVDAAIWEMGGEQSIMAG